MTQVVKLLRKKNYLAMIEASVAKPTDLFRNLFALVDGKEENITNAGKLSCAFFVSAVLYLNKLCADLHAGVTGLEKDLIEFGWRETREPKPGAVIFWEAKMNDYGVSHRHAGFYLSPTRAVSNDSNGLGRPIEHNLNPAGRKIKKIYWHSGLEGESW